MPAFWFQSDEDFSKFLLPAPTGNVCRTPTSRWLWLIHLEKSRVHGIGHWPVRARAAEYDTEVQKARAPNGAKSIIAIFRIIRAYSLFRPFSAPHARLAA